MTSHLRRAGAPLRRPGLNAEQTAEAADLYQAGWSSGRVAERFDASADTVLRHCGNPEFRFVHGVADLDQSYPQPDDSTR